MSNKKVDEALELYSKGEYQKAIDAFSIVLEECPENAELYNNIALCYANLADDEQAANLYKPCRYLLSSKRDVERN